MSKELLKTYEPHEVEKRWSEFWLKKQFFHAEAKSKKPSFCIVIPPPNVTGSLHMGHALNNTLQDILVRYKRMRGFNVLWVPGTDHAGIATQNVVERELKKEGKRRQDLGRERFIEEVWKWKEKHGSHIVHQLKRLGASCDWERERFTMDEGLSAAVREAFVHLYEKKLVYRDLYLINWCPRCHTALSDIEVEHEETEGSLWFIRYGEDVVVATTRPETMLGDTAVAVHPDDPRYKKWIGQKVTLPLANREIPVIADRQVDREFGTGAVKVTPAHDFNDFVIGNDHKLPRVNIFTEEATMNENAIHFQGLDRFECRKRIVVELEEKGFLVKTEPHNLSVGHCYRCKTVVEPSLSLQWFVKTKPLAERALQAVRAGKTKFHPPNWEKAYEQWMENIKDWCISRQIWWGHQIPAWYCIPPQPPLRLRGGEGGICPPIVSRTTPKKCPTCGSTELEQDPDVLDTWFSSGLWPFSTLGWPDQTPELKKFYPTSVLVTAHDILFFWVARMMMFGLEFMGEVPFRDVYIHALVRDAEGRKMSKSKGNVIDPLEIMDRFGTDAFRFTLAALAAQGRDIRLSEQVIEGYRNFCNKIWNAARYFLSQPVATAPPPLKDWKKGRGLSLYDKWILVSWDQTLKEVLAALEGYRFDEAAKSLYQFFWHTFCDWYVEFAKVRPNPSVFCFALESSLRALHPFMPFITEEIWQGLKRTTASEGEESITIAPYPEVQGWDFAKEVGPVLRLNELITAIRTIRGENEIPVSTWITPLFWFRDKKEEAWVRGEMEVIERLTHSRGVQFIDQKIIPKKMAHFALESCDLYVPLEGVVDLEGEKRRLEKEIQRLRQDQERREKKLSDRGFLDHASQEVVTGERERQKVVAQKLKRLEETFQNILKS